MSYQAAQPVFSGGEIGKQIAARYDTSKYATALERARNVILLPGGGFYNRPGFEFCGAAVDHTKRIRLIPFVFAVDQSYALEFSDELMRVYSGGRLVTKPKLTITAITKASQGVVTVANHGYSVGEVAYFEGVLGMTEINGREAEIVAVTTNTFTIDLNTTGFSTFTSDTGGVAGNSAGGVGGYPATPPTSLPGVGNGADTPPTTGDRPVSLP